MRLVLRGNDPVYARAWLCWRGAEVPHTAPEPPPGAPAVDVVLPMYDPEALMPGMFLRLAFGFWAIL